MRVLVPQQQRHVPDVGHVMDVQAMVGGHVAELGQLRLRALLQGLRIGDRKSGWVNDPGFRQAGALKIRVCHSLQLRLGALLQGLRNRGQKSGWVKDAGLQISGVKHLGLQKSGWVKRSRVTEKRVG